MLTKGIHYLVLVCLFAIPLLPLVVSNSFFFPFISLKGFLFRILIEIAASSWIMLALIDVRYRPRFSWTLVFFTGLTVWMFIANLFAVNPHKAFWSNFERMDGWILLIHLFLFFIVLGSMMSVHKLWKKWWMVFLGVSAVVCLYGIGQLICVGQVCGMQAQFFEIHQGGQRIDASFGNAIYLAVYLLFGVFISLWQAFESRGRLRNVLFVLAGAQTFILILTQTRGAIVGLFAGLVAAGVLFLFQKEKKLRTWGAGILITLVVSLGVLWVVRDAPLIQQTPMLSRFASVFSLQEALETRSTIWSVALQGSAERPIMGWGQEGFNYVFNKYYEPSLYGQEAWFDRVHNTYLDWLIAGGAPAFVLFIVLLVGSFIVLIRKGESPYVRVFLGAGIIAYGVQALVVFDNLFSYVPFVALLALAHTYQARPFGFTLPVVRTEVPKAITATLIVVVLFVSLWNVVIKDLIVSQSIIHARGSGEQGIAMFNSILASNPHQSQEVWEQMIPHSIMLIVSPEISNESKNSALVSTVEAIENELKRTPEDARILYEEAWLLRVSGLYNESIAVVEKALELSPKRQILLIEKINNLILLKDFEQARIVSDEVYPSVDADARLSIYPAISEIYLGNIEEGKEILRLAFGTHIVDIPEVLIAYYETKRYEETIAILDLQYESSGQSPEIQLRRAIVYNEAGNKEKARADVEEVIRKYPNYATIAAELLKQFDQVHE